MKQDWQIKKLGEVCDIINGRNQKAVESADGQYPIYGSGGNVIGYASDYLCEAGTTIIGRKGSINNPLYIDTKFWNVDTAFGISSKQMMSSKFVYYFCKSFDFSKLNKGTTLPSLVKKDLLLIDIPAPPLSEQQRIVALLDAEFAKIDVLKANAEKNLQNAKDLFQAALKKELEPKEGWTVVKLQEITEICLGLTHTPKYVEDGVPFVSVKDISSGYLDLSATKRISREEFSSFPYGAKPQRGDVLFCRVGTMGHPLVLEIDEEFGTFVSVGFLRPNTNTVSPYYLRYWMLSPMFNKQVDDNVVGSTLKNLNTGWLKHFSVPVPPKEHLSSLVEELTLLEQKCKTLQANYEKTLSLCDDLKQALLRKAFNGEL